MGVLIIILTSMMPLFRKYMTLITDCEIADGYSDQVGKSSVIIFVIR